MTMTQTITQTAGLVGNLASEPELRTSANGKPWCTLRLAVKPWLRGADVQPEPIYYDVVAFGLLAEHVCESLHRGDRVVVTGRIEEGPWTGRDGVERVTQKLIADGIGADLRFSVKRTDHRGPAVPVSTAPKPTPVLDGLLGPEPSHDYSDQPF